LPSMLTDEERAALEERMVLKSDAALRIVLVNGQIDQQLSSSALSNAQVRVRLLSEVLREDSALAQQYLCAHAKIGDSPFTALNTALLSEGVFVQVAERAVVELPVYIVHAVQSPNQSLAIHPRVVVVAGASAEALVFEHFLGRNGETYFTNHVTEIYAGENADLQHYKLQDESTSAFHIGTISFNAKSDSNARSFSLALGGSLARTDIIAELDGQGVECTLNGLYLGQGTQHIDHHTRLEHAKPNCHSTEVYKGILDDKATAVFVGLIHVHPDAQKTDAVQSSKCVLLSDDARVDSQPQLKIFADDVKCTHGAAIGQLDEEAIFYLRSRGIDEASARGLLTYAFANNIIERIRIEPLRQMLTDVVSRRFAATEYAELE